MQTNQKLQTIMPYNQAANTVYKILNYQLAKKGESPIFDKDMKRLYRCLTLYFTQNPEFENLYFNTKKGKIPYNLHKGILVIGETGRGKSFAFENIFNAFVAKFNKDLTYAQFNSYQIATDVENQGSKVISKYERMFYTTDIYTKIKKPRHIYIDEIGAENSVVNHYGNKIKPLMTILHNRHRAYVQNNALTFATSNLDIKKLEEHYDYRIKSRIFEMFNIISVEGNDLRLKLI